MSQAKGSWMRMAVLAGVLAFSSGAAAQTAPAENAAPNTAWGSYRTEFYPAYHYKAVGIATHEKLQ